MSDNYLMKKIQYKTIHTILQPFETQYMQIYKQLHKSKNWNKNELFEVIISLIFCDVLDFE